MDLNKIGKALIAAGEVLTDKEPTMKVVGEVKPTAGPADEVEAPKPAAKKKSTKKKAATRKAEPKAEPAKTEVQAPTTAKPEGEVVYDASYVRGLCKTIADQRDKEFVFSTMGEFGAARLSELAKDKYEAFAKELIKRHEGDNAETEADADEF